MAHKKPINWDIVELYIKAGCTQTKIAAYLYIDTDTLRDRVKEKYGVEYSIFSASLRSEGDLLIEAQQFQKAMKGYWPALQWLGKVRLGQKEPEVSNQLAPKQNEIDQSHIIMQQEHRIAELEADADKSKTE
jgi:hypothetical protein